jgi:hypothetical protein
LEKHDAQRAQRGERRQGRGGGGGGGEKQWERKVVDSAARAAVEIETCRVRSWLVNWLERFAVRLPSRANGWSR